MLMRTILKCNYNQQWNEIKQYPIIYNFDFNGFPSKEVFITFDYGHYDKKIYILKSKFLR